MATSLNKFVQWDRVLPILGVTPPQWTLPAVVPCPVCQESQLRIYHDPVGGEQWASCFHCDRHGDIIELAASAWKLDLPATYERLQQEGFELPQRHTHGEQIAIRRNVMHFWQTARSRLRQQTARSSELFSRLDIVPGMDAAGWDEGGGRFIGLADCEEVRNLLRSIAYGVNIQIFRGRGWTDCLVIPFWDAPGRITGFLFVGRRGDATQGDWVFRTLRWSNRRREPVEAGLLMLETLLQPPCRHFGDVGFIFDNPELALRLQLRWLRSNTIPLPIAASYVHPTAATGNLWRRLPAKPLIFCYRTLTPEVIRLAKAVNGQLVEVPGNISALLQVHLNISAWLRDFQQRAVPWQQRLEQALLERNSDELAGLTLQILREPQELQDFLSKCSAKLRDRLKSVMPPSAIARRVTERNKTVVETSTGWKVERSGVEIANGIVRVDRLLHTQAGRKFYQGRLLQQGEESQFLITEQQVRANGFFRAVQRSIPNGAQRLTFSPYWGTSGEQLALQFHTPTEVRNVDRIGWDSDQGYFRLANFLLQANGTVIADQTPRLLGTRIPTLNLPSPDGLEPRLATILDPVATPLSFWPLLACIVTNVLAPVFRNPPLRIGLLGEDGWISGLDAAKAMGCHEQEVSSFDSRTTVQHVRLQEHTSEHHWPLLLTRAPSKERRTRYQWITQPIGGNCIIAFDHFSGLVAKIHGWTLIEHPAITFLAPATKQIMGETLVAYLRDLCQRRLQLSTRYPQFTANVLWDFIEWVNQKTGQMVDFELALSLLTGPAEAPEGFVDLIGSFVRSRQLELQPLDAESLWIPTDEVNRLLTKTRVPSPDPAVVTQVLQTAGCLRDVRTLKNEPGWVIDAAWWRWQSHIRRVSRPRGLQRR